MNRTLLILAGGAVIGAAALMAFNLTLEATSSDAFCTSCHEMEQPFAALKETPHYKNAAGVQVHCRDCHIPHELGPKMVRKIEAAREVWGHLTGIIDTPEKYASHREAMQTRELARLRATDSQECRNCHTVALMDFTQQDRAVRRYHRAMAQRNKTCVDCHEGIAHPTP